MSLQTSEQLRSNDAQIPPKTRHHQGPEDVRHRAERVKDGWKRVGKVFVLALILDVIYQMVATHFVYPGEAIITALSLAIVPYLILRALVTRLVGKK